MSLPERAPLDVERLEAGLAAPWQRITVVAESGSTNTDLVARAADSPDGSVLVAEHQTAGLGRLGRQWSSPARSGLTVSVLLRPSVPHERWGWLPLLAGVALADTVTALGFSASLKWPNDLLLGGEQHQDELKAAGILVQVADDAVVIGIGVNVTTTADELPLPGTTSLARQGPAPDRTELLANLLLNLGVLYEAWMRSAGDAERSGVAQRYRDLCGTLGREVAVSAISGPSHGGFVTGIDPDGRLLLRTDAGVELSIAAGDVQHLRPAGR